MKTNGTGASSSRHKNWSSLSFISQMRNKKKKRSKELHKRKMCCAQSQITRAASEVGNNEKHINVDFSAAPFALMIKTLAPILACAREIMQTLFFLLFAFISWLSRKKTERKQILCAMSNELWCLATCFQFFSQKVWFRFVFLRALLLRPKRKSENWLSAIAIRHEKKTDFVRRNIET